LDWKITVLVVIFILDKDMVEELKVEIDGIAEKNKYVLDFQEITFDVIA
jgi:hypothetical protein